MQSARQADVLGAVIAAHGERATMVVLETALELVVEAGACRELDLVSGGGEGFDGRRWRGSGHDRRGGGSSRSNSVRTELADGPSRSVASECQDAYPDSVGAEQNGRGPGRAGGELPHLSRRVRPGGELNDQLLDLPPGTMCRPPEEVRFSRQACSFEDSQRDIRRGGATAPSMRKARSTVDSFNGDRRAGSVAGQREDPRAGFAPALPAPAFGRLSRLAKSRYAPGTPAGSCRKNERPV